MFLRHTINLIFIVALWSQPIMIFGLHAEETIDSPYRSEYNPWFKLGTFQRGYKNEYLTEKLDSLESKPRKNWTRTDSLNFAEISKKTGNLELAAYYFENLQVDFSTEEKYWWEQLVLHFLQHEYNTCLRLIREAEPGLVEHSKLWFFKKMCDAKLRSLKDEKWFKKESVLSWQIDSSLLNVEKSNELFNEKIIEPLENLTYVLELLIRHIYADDEVIARTCLEAGWILDAYISPTQSYIMMSIGRNYDKWDKEITENIKIEKAKLVEKKYRIPIFRKYFPRVEEWRFDYELLKEKILYERNDTLVKTPPELRKEPERKGLKFNTQLALTIGLAIIFFSLLIFLRTGKNTS